MDMDSLGKPLIDGVALIISGGAGWIANTAKEKVKDPESPARKALHQQVAARRAKKGGPT